MRSRPWQLRSPFRLRPHTARYRIREDQSAGSQSVRIADWRGSSSGLGCAAGIRLGLGPVWVRSAVFAMSAKSPLHPRFRTCCGVAADRRSGPIAVRGQRRAMLRERHDRCATAHKSVELSESRRMLKSHKQAINEPVCRQVFVFERVAWRRAPPLGRNCDPRE